MIQGAKGIHDIHQQDCFSFCIHQFDCMHGILKTSAICLPHNCMNQAAPHTFSCISKLIMTRIALHICRSLRCMTGCDTHIWIIPYQFTEALHMTPSELDEIWCVGSPGGPMCPKGVSPSLLVWLSRNCSFNILLFCYFYCTCDHSKHHNLGIFYGLEK